MQHGRVRRASADLALSGTTIRTLDPERPWATAVAMRDGIIVAVGSDDEVREVCDSRTEIVAGPSWVVTPGLVDAHVHPFLLEETRGLDLSRCASLAELQQRVSASRRRDADGGWVLGWGLDYGVFRDHAIHGDLLREAADGAPVLITFTDTHTAVATSRALELAGVTGGETFQEAAEVVVRDGSPTGELRESAAIQLVRGKVAPLTPAELRARAVANLQRMNVLGLTGAHVMTGDPETLDFVADLEATGELAVRLILPLWQRPDTPVDEMRRQLALCGQRGQRWRCGVAKFFIDGVVDSGTAWLYEPDELGDGSLPFWPQPERYREAVALFAAAGFQCVTHAVGDRAVREALDAYRVAARASAPHRIEHIETARLADIARFASEGVGASMQPLHMEWRRQDASDSWATRLGPERTSRAFPTRALLGHGVGIALGSDWPVADIDPRVGMAWARLRRTPGERSLAPFEPEQRMTGEEALAGYTAEAARIVGEASFAGTVAIGGRADLTCFEADPVTCDADDLPDLPITLTIVDGAVTHRA